MADKLWSRVEAREMINTRRESFDKLGRPKFSVVLQVDWLNRWSLIRDLYTSLDPRNTVANQFIGYRPRAFPDFFNKGVGEIVPESIGQPLVGFSAASMETMRECFTTDGSKQVMEYKNAFVRCTYDRYFDIEDSLEFDAQFLKLDNTLFAWKSEATNTPQSRILRESEAPGQIFHNPVLTRNFKGVSPALLTNIKDAIGFTNIVPYFSIPLGILFDEETLLMEDPLIKPSINLSGELPPPPAETTTPDTSPFFGSGFDVTFRFGWKPQGHNVFWRPKKQQSPDPEPPTPAAGFFDTMVVQDQNTKQTDWIDYKPFATSPGATVTLPIGVDSFLSLAPSHQPTLAPDDRPDG